MKEITKEIKALLEDQKEYKRILNVIEQDLTAKIWGLPQDVLNAIAHGIVKPIF